LSIMGVEKDTLVLLRKYNVDACLVSAGSPIATFLGALPDWQRAYADGLSAILVRRKGS
jgi:hypothetical protein